MNLAGFDDSGPDYMELASLVEQDKTQPSVQHYTIRASLARLQS